MNFSVTAGRETGSLSLHDALPILAGTDSGDNTTAGKVTIDSLEPGQEIASAHVSTQVTRVTIMQDTAPNDTQDFSYIGTGPGVDATFPLDDDGTNTGTGGDINNTV